MWNDSMVEELREHHRKGLSASQIATMINARYSTDFSRNAVIGKLHRTGIVIVKGGGGVNPAVGKHRPKGTRQESAKAGSIFRPTKDITASRASSARVQALKEAAGVKKRAPVVSTEPLHPAPAEGLTFLELQHHSCRWPVAERDGEHIFCGASREEGGPYCCAHARRAYATPHRTKNFKYRQSGATIQADE